MSLSNPEPVSYKANCHCGAVTFTIRTLSLSDQQVTRCDCSICNRNGYLLVHLKRGDVEFHTGVHDMASYSFGNKRGAHKFCAKCGSSAMIEFDGTEDSELWINVSIVKT
jgi:hypothetical protein